jgi:hypothetical protein
MKWGFKTVQTRSANSKEVGLTTCRSGIYEDEVLHVTGRNGCRSNLSSSGKPLLQLKLDPRPYGFQAKQQGRLSLGHYISIRAKLSTAHLPLEKDGTYRLLSVIHCLPLNCGSLSHSFEISSVILCPWVLFPYLLYKAESR